MQREVHLARYNKVWAHRQTGEIGTVELELKPGENLLDYMQVDKPKSRPTKQKIKKKPAYSFSETNEESDKGVF